MAAQGNSFLQKKKQKYAEISEIFFWFRNTFPAECWAWMSKIFTIDISHSHLYCPGAVDLVLLPLPLHPALGQQSVPHRPGRGVDEPEQSFCLQTIIKELTDLSMRLLSSLEKAVPIFGANWSAASSSSPCVSIHFMKKLILPLLLLLILMVCDTLCACTWSFEAINYFFYYTFCNCIYHLHGNECTRPLEATN